MRNAEVWTGNSGEIGMEDKGVQLSTTEFEQALLGKLGDIADALRLGILIDEHGKIHPDQRWGWFRALKQEDKDLLNSILFARQMAKDEESNA